MSGRGAKFRLIPTEGVEGCKCRRCSISSAAQGSGWQVYRNKRLLSLGCKDEPRARRQQHRAAPPAAPGSSSYSWEGLCIALHLVLQQIPGIPQNFRKSRFRRSHTIHSTFFFCPRMCSLQNLLSLVVGVLNISVPWNAFPRLHRGWAVQSAPFC